MLLSACRGKAEWPGKVAGFATLFYSTLDWNAIKTLETGFVNQIQFSIPTVFLHTVLTKSRIPILKFGNEYRRNQVSRRLQKGVLVKCSSYQRACH